MASFSWFLLFSLIISTIIIGSATTSTDPNNAAAMLVPAQSIGADSSLNWSPTSDPCTQWPCIQCNSSNKVITIQIRRISNLFGTLPPQIVNLTSFERIEAQQVGLRGPLPLFSPAIRILLLNNKNFSSVPTNFFAGLAALTTVFLDHNLFSTWEIPASLTECFALVNFSTNSASLSGGVPHFFATAFLVLEHLALANNMNLGGEIPASFANTNTGLKSLWLNGCNLSSGKSVVSTMSQTSAAVQFLDGP